MCKRNASEFFSGPVASSQPHYVEKVLHFSRSFQAVVGSRATRSVNEDTLQGHYPASSLNASG